MKRKRDQERKESEVTIHSRKYTRQEVAKEIARHVFPREMYQNDSANTVLPDYITVSTPLAQTPGISRKILLHNLPWYQYKQAIHTVGRLYIASYSTSQTSLTMLSVKRTTDNNEQTSS